MRKRIWTDDQLINAVKKNESIVSVLKELGLKLSGGSYATIKSKIQQLGLDISHFTGQGWCKGEKHKAFIKRVVQYPLEQILVVNSTYQDTHGLKRRLVKENILEYECSKCKIKEWLGQPISLQLHHKDGDRCNNTIQNLTILCPNCHSQTSSFGGKNKNKTTGQVVELAYTTDLKSVAR